MRYRERVRRASLIVTGLLLLVVPVVTGPGATAGFPGANGAIAFGRLTNGQNDIWVLPPASTTPHRLTNTPGLDESMPDYRADGRRIAFVRCGQSEFANCEIWTMRADGSDPTRLTFSPGVQETWPTWSPDGSKIAFTSDAADVF